VRTNETFEGRKQARKEDCLVSIKGYEQRYASVRASIIIMALLLVRSFTPSIEVFSFTTVRVEHVLWIL
jgi:hypothetical protein